MNNVDCKCPKKKCPRHGDCVKCEEFHREGKRPPYCKREISIFRKIFNRE